jgi:hypothetical protein
VLSGARALCTAEHDDLAAQALGRAALEDGFVTAGSRSVRRFVLRLDAADFARAERDRDLGDRLMRAVRTAAVTAAETTIAVQLGVRLVDVDLPAGPETWFVRAMSQQNAVVVPIVRNETCTRFAVVYQEELFLVLMQKQKGSSWFKKSGSVEWETEGIPIATISAQTIESADGADVMTTEILRTMSAGRS